MILGKIETPVETLSGVGPASAKLFAKLNIFTVADLLSAYPRTYEDRTHHIPLHDFASAKVHTICKVTAHEWFGYGRMKTLKIAITDGSANAWLIAFNRSFLKDSLPEGSIIAVTGKFEIKYNTLQSTSFEAIKIANDGELSEFENSSIPGSGIIPVYPLTEGLSQKTFRKSIAQALKQYAKAIDDELPQDIIEKRNLLHKKEAIRFIHEANSFEEVQKARHTLIYEELFLFEKKLALRTLEHRGTLPTVSETAVFEQGTITSSENKETDETDTQAAFEQSLSPKQKALFNRLTFALTSDQMKAITCMNYEIDKSESERNQMITKPQTLNRNPFCMQRLLQGDVGAGKTLVAFFACLRVIDYGGQCAFMAPTELLARQHADNASRLLEALDVKVAFLTGNIKSAGRELLLSSLKKGDIHIVIGTHALFSQGTVYKSLRLAVIDEQHRFGVTQRESIIAKGRVVATGTEKPLVCTPSLLMMSATPIPQTLALTVFGDLDVSVIKTMPQGRKPIRTYLSVMGHEQNVYEAVRKELSLGHQAYFVYPRIAEDEGNSNTKLKSAEDMFTYLQTQVYPNSKCALVHSKIEEEKQNEILSQFREGSIQILVATTVVEVGVDVANATCMVIEHANRFGLAELHQLRGRVGRGCDQSYCFLIYDKNISEDGIARMKALHESTDGFVIAEEDLKLRGPGQVSGTMQSGFLTLSIADFERDKDTLVQARYDAFSSLSKH